MIIGIEGPSYSGKTTLSTFLKKKFTEKGWNVNVFSCYMALVTDLDKSWIPLDATISLKEELRVLELLIDIEASRYNQIEISITNTIHILDRTVISILGHNYALQKITKKPFYKNAKKFINTKLSKIVIPDVHIFMNIPQSVLEIRYPTSDSTIFTDANYNDHFIKHFSLEARKQTAIKRVIEINFNNSEAIFSQVQKIIPAKK